jgi:hypothetical protein
MVSDGSKRQSMIQAARQLILSQELPKRLQQHSLKWGRRTENVSNRKLISPREESNAKEEFSDELSPVGMFEK